MTVRFGPFELETASGELRKEGAKLRLQDQPLRVLGALVERPGELVTREELRKRLWSDDTFVDFDNSLNNAVNRLRAVLGDDAARPRFVETVGRRGYRFIAPVSADAAPQPASAPEAPVRSRLAVLPFRMLRADAEVEFLTSSLPDAVAASLSGLESLAVRSPIAAARFAAAAPDLPAIAAALDANLLLTGTVLRAASRVRITTQLVEAPHGRLLWTHTAEETVEDLFRLQDDLARRVVESLALPLNVREHEMLQRDVPTSGRAYEQYLRANRLSQEPVTWLAARDLYLEAVREDPRYAPAWARLGRIYRLMAKYGAGNPRESTALAEESFRRALALNPELSVAHHFYAQLEMESGRTREALVRLLGRAREHPADAQIFAALVQACRYAGLLHESVAAHARARRLDPNVPSSIGHTLRALGDWERAEAESRTDPVFHVFALAALRRRDEAVERIDEALATCPDHPIQRTWLRLVRAVVIEEPSLAARCIDEILQSPFRDPEGFFVTATLAMWVGDFERATRALVRASAEGFASLPELNADFLAPLKDRPEFARVRGEVETRHGDALAAFESAGGRAILSA